MQVSDTITWNGVSPRLEKPDPLWHMLELVLVLIADRGERIRWQSTPEPQSLAIQVLVGDTWYEAVPPLWTMSHLTRRLVSLTARSCWDRWALWRQHRRHVRAGACLLWKRPVTLRLHGEPIPAACRVHCETLAAEIELAIAAPDEHLAAKAAETLAVFEEMVSQHCDRFDSAI